MLRKMRFAYLGVGFLVGIVYLVACGGIGQGIASSLGNAIDLVYSNATSSLSATNVQAAIDEVTSSMHSLSLTTGKLTAASLSGGWTGTGYAQDGEVAVNLTLNTDGTYSCGGQFSVFQNACQQTIAWDVVANSIRLRYGNPDAPDYRYLQINYCNSNTLQFVYGTNALAELTK